MYRQFVEENWKRDTGLRAMLSPATSDALKRLEIGGHLAFEDRADAPRTAMADGSTFSTCLQGTVSMTEMRQYVCLDGRRGQSVNALGRSLARSWSLSGGAPPAETQAAKARFPRRRAGGLEKPRSSKSLKARFGPTATCSSQS